MSGPRPKSNWITKFANAFRGVAVGIRGQNSFVVHIPMAVAVVTLALILNLELHSICILLICIGVVLSSELFNSAIESLAKAVTEKEDPRIRDALDIASGAVLTVSAFAAIVGVLLLGTGLLQMFEN